MARNYPRKRMALSGDDRPPRRDGAEQSRRLGAGIDVIILGTAPGERVMRPYFGCDIHELLFAPTMSILRALLLTTSSKRSKSGNLASKMCLPTPIQIPTSRTS